MYDDYPDSELISLWKSGKLVAFEEIYKRYLIRLINLARLKTGDQETAKEIVQDVFMSLYLNKDNIQTHTTLHSYLTTILKNTIFNFKRKELVRARYVESIKTDIEESENLIAEQMDAITLENYINRQIELLPNQCKTVFKMSRYDNLSHKEIAEKLSISTNTVEQHIRKALKVLRENVKNFSMLLLIIKYL